ncbi:hypothetical protein DIPPA_50612 [Diplonema papillatum]|nr:hypothetical protein DIPPA_50612 [Diplonema papillatum]
MNRSLLLELQAIGRGNRAKLHQVVDALQTGEIHVNCLSPHDAVSAAIQFARLRVRNVLPIVLPLKMHEGLARDPYLTAEAIMAFSLAEAAPPSCLLDALRHFLNSGSRNTPYWYRSPQFIATTLYCVVEHPSILDMAKTEAVPLLQGVTACFDLPGQTTSKKLSRKRSILFSMARLSKTDLVKKEMVRLASLVCAAEAEALTSAQVSAMGSTLGFQQQYSELEQSGSKPSAGSEQRMEPLSPLALWAAARVNANLDASVWNAGLQVTAEALCCLNACPFLPNPVAAVQSTSAVAMSSPAIRGNLDVRRFLKRIVSASSRFLSCSTGAGFSAAARLRKEVRQGTAAGTKQKQIEDHLQLTVGMAADILADLQAIDLQHSLFATSVGGILQRIMCDKSAGYFLRDFDAVAAANVACSFAFVSFLSKNVEHELLLVLNSGLAAVREDVRGATDGRGQGERQPSCDLHQPTTSPLKNTESSILLQHARPLSFRNPLHTVRSLKPIFSALTRFSLGHDVRDTTAAACSILQKHIRTQEISITGASILAYHPCCAHVFRLPFPNNGCSNPNTTSASVASTVCTLNHLDRLSEAEAPTNAIHVHTWLPRRLVSSNQVLELTSLHLAIKNLNTIASPLFYGRVYAERCITRAAHSHFLPFLTATATPTTLTPATCSFLLRPFVSLSLGPQCLRLAHLMGTYINLSAYSTQDGRTIIDSAFHSDVLLCDFIAVSFAPRWLLSILTNSIVNRGNVSREFVAKVAGIESMVPPQSRNLLHRLRADAH